MHINFDKTTYIVLGTQYELQDAQFLNLIMDDHNVKQVSQQKLLGLHIDDTLSFTIHTENIASTETVSICKSRGSTEILSGI